MNGLIGLGGVLSTHLLVGAMIGLSDRSRFDSRWLVVAALLVALNDALLTRAYGLLPDLIGGDWNWQGKLLALGATLSIAARPAFGWRRCGAPGAGLQGCRAAGLPGCRSPANIFLSYKPLTVLQAGG